MLFFSGRHSGCGCGRRSEKHLFCRLVNQLLLLFLTGGRESRRWLKGRSSRSVFWSKNKSEHNKNVRFRWKETFFFAFLLPFFVVYMGMVTTTESRLIVWRLAGPFGMWKLIRKRFLCEHQSWEELAAWGKFMRNSRQIVSHETPLLCENLHLREPLKEKKPSRSNLKQPSDVNLCSYARSSFFCEFFFVWLLPQTRKAF